MFHDTSVSSAEIHTPRITWNNLRSRTTTCDLASALGGFFSAWVKSQSPSFPPFRCVGSLPKNLLEHEGGWFLGKSPRLPINVIYSSRENDEEVYILAGRCFRHGKILMSILSILEKTSSNGPFSHCYVCLRECSCWIVFNAGVLAALSIRNLCTPGLSKRGW